MKKLIIALLFFSFTLPIYAQWERPYYDIFSVCFASNGPYIFSGKNGASRTSNSGLSWELINNNFPNVQNRFQVNRMYVHNGILYAGLDTMGVYTSSNSGAQWTQRNTGFPANIVVKTFAGYGNTIFCGTDKGIFKSTTNGAVWNLTAMADTLVVDMIFRDSILFASRYPSGVRMSTDMGQTWQNRNFGIENRWVFSFTNTPQYLVIGTSNAEIYRSGNLGQTWDPKISFTPAFNAIYTLRYYDNRLIAGTAQGIYYSYNQGNDWLQKIDGLPPNTEMRSDAMIFFNNYLFIGPTNGVYRRPLSQLTGVPVSSNINANNFELKQNYPNPFNPATQINYELRNTNYVLLKVYDVNGNEIAELVNEKKTAGSYSVSFDAAKYNLSSGVYFYKLSTENFEDVKRMVLVK